MILRASAQIHIEQPAETVFDFITAPDAVARTFRGHGPIPGAKHSEILGGGAMAHGSIRRVHNDDGSQVDEEIVEFVRPTRQAYRLIAGMKPPFTWFVRTASGRWALTSQDRGTAIDWTFQFELTTPLVLPLALPLRGSFQKAMQESLETTRLLLDGPRT